MVAALFIVAYVMQFLMIGALFLGAWFGNWALLCPARRVLYGLVRTLIATPGTTPWEHLHTDVIALEVPGVLATLRAPCKKQKDRVIELAEKKTKMRLAEILKAFERDDAARRG